MFTLSWCKVDVMYLLTCDLLDVKSLLSTCKPMSNICEITMTNKYSPICIDKKVCRNMSAIQEPTIIIIIIISVTSEDQNKQLTIQVVGLNFIFLCLIIFQEDAERLYKNCGRYDLLNAFYQASGQWGKVGHSDSLELCLRRKIFFKFKPKNCNIWCEITPTSGSIFTLKFSTFQLTLIGNIFLSNLLEYSF